MTLHLTFPVMPSTKRVEKFVEANFYEYIYEVIQGHSTCIYHIKKITDNSIHLKINLSQSKTKFLKVKKKTHTHKV